MKTYILSSLTNTLREISTFDKQNPDSEVPIVFTTMVGQAMRAVNQANLSISMTDDSPTHWEKLTAYQDAIDSLWLLTMYQPNDLPTPITHLIMQLREKFIKLIEIRNDIEKELLDHVCNLSA